MIEHSPLFPISAFRQRRETYIGADKAVVEKDIYRFLMEKLAVSGCLASASVLDVGCATGDLLAYLAPRLDGATLAGLDIDQDLINVARGRPELCNARLDVGDAQEARLGRFDIVTCFGVLGIFDRFEPLLENLVANTAIGGRIFVQALLNPDDIEVRVAYKDYPNRLDWMRGFNIFPRARVAEWAHRLGYEVSFHNFQMTSELPKRPHLPHRAFTIDLADGSRRTTNGLCLLLPETLMELHVRR